MDFRRVGGLKPRVYAILAAGLIAAASFIGMDAAHLRARVQRSSLRPAVNPSRLAVDFGRLPLGFEPNQGQSNASVKFVARGSGYGLFLTGNEAVLSLQGVPPQNKASILRMSLQHADAFAAVDGTDPLPGKSNYLIGNDPAKWRVDIPQFERVRYRNVYPGIDLVYYGIQGKLEYDFEVAPGADPKQIALKIDGARKLALAANEDLKMATASGEVELQAPRLYQQRGNNKQSVPGRFVVREGSQITFEIGDYDHSRALIIDPVLSYSTYLGGSGSESCSAIDQTQLGISTALFTPSCPAVAVDAAFRTYVAGATTSLNFPGITAPGSTSPSYQECLDTAAAQNPTSPAGCTALTSSDVFITRLNAAGTALDFSTYLGGSGSDVPGGMAVDQNFNVHVAGTTNSADFPTSPVTAFQSAPASTGTHVFVSEVNSSGTKLIYSTYLSGHGTDVATGIAVDNLGKEYVSGTTTSPAFPTSGGFPTTPTGAQPKAVNQYFFSKLDPTISGPGSLVFSTYLGGSAPANGVAMGGGIAVDSSCNAYLTGGTNFTDMPSQNASQGTNLGGIDAWLAKFAVAQGSSCGSQLSLQYLTYLGGSGDDIGYSVAVDTGLSVYITGSTTSPNITFPVGSTAPVAFAKCLDAPPPTNMPYFPTCPSNGTASDAFIAKFGPLATTSTTGTNVPFNYFTYLGGTGADAGTAIAVDSIGGASVTGWTNSPDFPRVGGATQTSYGGGASDAFFARVDTTTVCASNPPTVVCPGFSTYLGGSLADIGTSIALDSQGGTYLVGETNSPDFPVASPLQATLNGPSDAFVTKFGSVGNFTITPTAPATVGVGNSVAFTYTITNTGDAASNVLVTDTLPSTATLSSISASSGSCGATVGSIVTCSVGSLNTGATVTVTVNLIPTAPATPLTSPGQLSNSIFVTSPGAQQKTVSSTAQIQDFNIQVLPGTPSTITVPAGVPASFTFQIFGTLNTFPDSISLSAAAGLPTPSTTAWSTNPIPSLAGSAQTSVLTISTTARVTTTGKLWRTTRFLYALCVPIFGTAFLGLGVGAISRRRKALVGMVLGGFFALTLFQAGCGGGGSSTTTTTGTPAGTYTITIDATSGSATRTTTVTLIVQ